MAIADANGLPIAVHTTTAQIHEVRLVTATLDAGFLDSPPVRVIVDKAYASDPLDQALADQGDYADRPPSAEPYCTSHPRWSGRTRLCPSLEG